MAQNGHLDPLNQQPKNLMVAAGRCLDIQVDRAAAERREGFIKRRMFNRIGEEWCGFAQSIGGKAMSYRIVFWSAVGWVVLCLAPYVYALNDLITWR
jgi:hypothetical protein